MSQQVETAATLRRARELLRQHDAAERAPAVLWAHEGENEEAFAVRCVKALGRCSLVLAVIPTGFAVPDGVRAVPLPPKHFKVLHPSNHARFKVLKGGRGSAKSWSIARALVVMALERPLSVLCGREIQNSIRASVHKVLAHHIRGLGLTRWFNIDVRAISAHNGSTFDFEGLRHNVDRIRSFEGADIVWIEEASNISAESWEVLEPTLRKEGSFFVVNYNPDAVDAPTNVMFAVAPRPDAVVEHVTYVDNPYLPEPLRKAAEYLQGVDDDAFRHVWLGECRAHSDAQVLKGKIVIDDFEPEPEWSGPYFGLDFGFSQDPTAGVRCYVHERNLYIAAEVWQIGCDIDATPRLLDGLGAEVRRYPMRADSARPETISYLKQHGFPNVTAVKKWGGSVLDGVAHLRCYERIVIHQSCEHAVEEGRLYSYKTDRLTGLVLPDVIDKFNHVWDAVRYALGDLIKMTSNADSWIEYAKRVNALTRGEARSEKSEDVQHPLQSAFHNGATAKHIRGGSGAKMLERIGAAGIATKDLG